VDMVLGDGARDRGATADLISTDPDIGAGVAFVRLEADPDPVRVRAAWVTDEDIKAMATQCTAAFAPDHGLHAMEGEAA
jgi:DNA segregation ATPase FtsK/SpoIIIE, S-DNA-T family